MNFYFDLIIEYLKNNLIGVICIILSVFIIFELKVDKDKIDNNVIDYSFENVLNNEEEIILDTFYVDIKGYVKKPGVYQFDSSNNVNDAIKKAGGVLKNADTKYINLSKSLSKEMVIYVPKKNSVKKVSSNEIVLSNGETINNQVSVISSNNVGVDKIPEYNNEKEDNNVTNNSLININIASTDELMSLSGVGEAKAKDIINYRESNGLFKSIEDIKKVSGIGDSLFEKIKDYITV